MENLTSEELRRIDAFLDYAEERLKGEDPRININPLAIYLGVMVGYCRRLVSQLTPEGVTHTHEFTEDSVTGTGKRCAISHIPERHERLPQQRVPYDKRWTLSSPPPEVDWADLTGHKKSCPIRRGEKECTC